MREAPEHNTTAVAAAALAPAITHIAAATTSDADAAVWKFE